MFKLLNWQSKQINWVVRSTLVAEIVTLNDAVDDGIYISDIVSELLFYGTKSLPIEIYTNTKSLYDAIKSKKKHFRKKIKVWHSYAKRDVWTKKLLQIFTILVQCFK